MTNEEIEFQKQNTLKERPKVEVSIKKQPSFREVWYEGHVTYNGAEHKFWLIDPQDHDPEGYEYECEVRWFFKRVPVEVRAMMPGIILMYKQRENDKRKKDGEGV